MQTQEIVDKIRQLKAGAFVRLVWRRRLKTLQTAGNRTIEKASSCVVRLGVEYDNIQSVQDKRASGELPEENQGLKGKKWLEYPLFLTSEKDGGLLIRLSTVKGQKASTTFFVDGKEVPADEVRPLCYSSEFAKRPHRDSFDLAVNNLTELEVVKL